MFADDTSLFSLVLNPIDSASKLNRDLLRISNWAYQWKMSFNPDPSKQAVEIRFTKKLEPLNPPSLTFSGTDVQVCESHKHLIKTDTENKDSMSSLNEHFFSYIINQKQTKNIIKKISLMRTMIAPRLIKQKMDKYNEFRK